MSFTNIERIVLISLTGISAIIFFYALFIKIRHITSGQPVNRFDRFFRRFINAFIQVVFQNKVIYERPFSGIAHFIIYICFLLYLLVTVDHFSTAFGDPILGTDTFHHYYYLIVKILSLGVLVSVLYFAIRRLVVKPKFFNYPPTESLIILTFISLHMISYLLTEFSDGQHQKIFWWSHTIIFLGFMDYFLFSKHRHLLFAPINIFFKSFRLAEIRPLDLEDLDKEDFGINTSEDFTWKDNLDGFACILCGRCTELCPANISGKDLNPREIITDSKNALVSGKNEQPVIGNFIDNKVIWQCTTCGSCETVCPTGNEHLPKIIGLRRYQVAESNFPSEANAVFSGMEKNYNPWNYGSHLREEFITNNKLPFFDENSDYLLFIGCFGTFDQGYQKSILAFIEILRRFSVNFGVLENEFCCGDPVRRLGNEMLYQMVAEQNTNTIKERGITRIITACPHCYHTLSSDYKDYEVNLEVIHHTEFLDKLINSENLNFTEIKDEKFVYHDPCYLSRYNKITEPPRHLMKSIKALYEEPENTKSKSYCCGGGGGRLFLEEPEGEKINHIRFDELFNKQNNIVTACPYCITMLRDAAGDKDIAEKSRIIDISELTLERIKKLQ